ncbi:MAG: hypothetical protein V1733_05085, partial [bacterium]
KTSSSANIPGVAFPTPRKSVCIRVIRVPFLIPSRKLGHEGSHPEFIGHQDFSFPDQQPVYPYIELVLVHFFNPEGNKISAKERKERVIFKGIM